MSMACHSSLFHIRVWETTTECALTACYQWLAAAPITLTYAQVNEAHCDKKNLPDDDARSSVATMDDGWNKPELL
jgi:hypothetical protein